MTQQAADSYRVATDDSQNPGWFKMGAQVYDPAKYRLTYDDKRRQPKYVICPRECEHESVTGTQCHVCLQFLKLQNDEPVTSPQCFICDQVLCQKTGGYSCACKKYFIEGTGRTCGRVICNTLFSERIIAHLLCLEKTLVIPGEVRDMHMTAEIVRGEENLEKAECYKCFEKFSVFWKYSDCSFPRHPYVLEEGGIVPDRLSVVQNEFTDWEHPKNLSKDLPQAFLLHSAIIGYCKYSTVSVRATSYNHHVCSATIMPKNQFKRSHEAFEKEQLELLAKRRREIESVERSRREVESTEKQVRNLVKEEDDSELDSEDDMLLTALEAAIERNKSNYKTQMGAIR